jgi:hypothetical protein
MAGVRDPESGRSFSDDELAWIGTHLTDLRQSVAERRIRKSMLCIGLGIGLVAHVAGFLTRRRSRGSRLGCLRICFTRSGGRFGAVWSSSRSLRSSPRRRSAKSAVRSMCTRPRCGRRLAREKIRGRSSRANDHLSASPSAGQDACYRAVHLHDSCPRLHRAQSGCGRSLSGEVLAVHSHYPATSTSTTATS